LQILKGVGKPPFRSVDSKRPSETAKIVSCRKPHVQISAHFVASELGSDLKPLPHSNYTAKG